MGNWFLVFSVSPQPFSKRQKIWLGRGQIFDREIMRERAKQVSAKLAIQESPKNVFFLQLVWEERL